MNYARSIEYYAWIMGSQNATPSIKDTWDFPIMLKGVCVSPIPFEYIICGIKMLFHIHNKCDSACISLDVSYFTTPFKENCIVSIVDICYKVYPVSR